MEISIPFVSIIGILCGAKGLIDNNPYLMGFGVIWVLADIAFAIRERNDT